jgi:membrane dipeptidase
MLAPGWKIENAKALAVKLENVIDHIDYICQLAGGTSNVAIGSDLDGGFGTEQSPGDLDTIADLQKLAPLLRRRGYSESDVTAIFHGNWIRFFEKVWGGHYAHA